MGRAPIRAGALWCVRYTAQNRTCEHASMRTCAVLFPLVVRAAMLPCVGGCHARVSCQRAFASARGRARAPSCAYCTASQLHLQLPTSTSTSTSFGLSALTLALALPRFSPAFVYLCVASRCSRLCACAHPRLASPRHASPHHACLRLASRRLAASRPGLHSAALGCAAAPRRLAPWAAPSLRPPGCTAGR